MKSYTDLEQSKKLIEILPLESADMYYSKYETTYAKTLTKYDITNANVLYGSYDIRYFNICERTPCWSLAALYSILPTFTLDSSDDKYFRIHCYKKISEWYNNPIDACVEMIIKLKDLNLL